MKIIHDSNKIGVFILSIDAFTIKDSSTYDLEKLENNFTSSTFFFACFRIFFEETGTEYHCDRISWFWFHSTTLMPPGSPGVSREAKLSTEFEFGSLVR